MRISVFFTPGFVLFSIVLLAASLIAGMVDVTTTIDSELCSYSAIYVHHELVNS